MVYGGGRGAYVMEALKTDHIKTVLFILRIIDKEERKKLCTELTRLPLLI